MIDALDMRRPRIKLCSTEPSRLEDVRELLDVANYQPSFGSLSMEGLERDGLEELDLVVVEGPRQAEGDVLEFCRRFRERLNERFVPLILLTDDPGHVLRAFSSRIGTDGHIVRPLDPVTLLSQVQALLRVKLLQDRVVQQADELRDAHQRLRIAYSQIDQELTLARRIQESMLPQELPNRGRARFAAKLAVSGRVSGDIYDVIEIDHDRTAFYVADAMGHGVPAGLITILVKKGVQPFELNGGRRALSPSEVLGRLNRDLLDQNLSENPFITMCYFVLHRSDLRLELARGGHPHPLLLRGGAPIAELRAEGGLLGVFETEFPTTTHRLAPGDKVLTYSDGVDAVVFQGRRPGVESFRACVEAHQDLPIDELIEAVYQELFPTRRHDDDLTLLGLEISRD